MASKSNMVAKKETLIVLVKESIFLIFESKMAAILKWWFFVQICKISTNLSIIHITDHLILHLCGQEVQWKLLKIKDTINFYNSNH